MSEQLHQLAGRIRRALEELEVLVRRIEEGWRRAEQSADDYFIDSVALNLHGFYSGVERIFQLVATVIDGVKPEGQHWHRALLEQMATERAGIRPAVISASTRANLDEYRGFRHVVRNVYSFTFDPARMETLVLNVRSVFEQIRAELLAFADFLDEQPSV